MKNILTRNDCGKIGLTALAFMVCLGIGAQTSPVLSMSKDAQTSVQINWANEPGVTYRLLFTPALAQTGWSPLEDAFSSQESVAVSLSSAASLNGFFSVLIPTNTGVEIFSLADNQTVSGKIAVGIGAQVGAQLQNVDLYLDGALVGSVSSGGIEFDLDTTHFPNGAHSIYAVAVDASNNQTTSATLTLDFENLVRWLDPEVLFQSFVPIDVESDVFPADWAVFVSDTNGMIVRAISGNTQDGIISTNWDGNDENGVYLPDENIYNIEIVVSASSSSGLLRTANSSLTAAMASVGSDEPVVSSRLNKYGVLESEKVDPAPDPALVYAEMRRVFDLLPDSLKKIYPPIPANPPAKTRPLLVKKLTAKDIFLANHSMVDSPQSKMLLATMSRGGASPNASGAASGSSGTSVWREASWSSGQMVLARQKIRGIAGLFFDGAVASLFEQVNTLVEAADPSGNGGRGVYQNSVLLIQHNGDFDQVRNALAATSPNTRAFYFRGHGSPHGNAIGFSEGSPNDGILARDLRDLLGNHYTPARNGMPLQIITHKPFNMVFLDGCMTGLGNFPDAFGITKVTSDVSFERYTKHRRSYMGWGGETTLSILDTETLNWSLYFWNTWLGDPAMGIHDAILQASAHHPNGGNGSPMLLYGSYGLTWAE